MVIMKKLIIAGFTVIALAVVAASQSEIRSTSATIACGGCTNKMPTSVECTNHFMACGGCTNHIIACGGCTNHFTSIQLALR